MRFEVLSLVVAVGGLVAMVSPEDGELELVATTS